MSKHLIIAGGGHAHLTLLLRCAEYARQGHRVTVVNTSAYHYYSGMGPGVLSGYYRPQDIRFNIRKMASDRGAAFREDAVMRVDPHGREVLLRSGERLPYDVLSFNTGSDVPLDDIDVANGDVYTVKPISNLLALRRRMIELLNQTRPRAVVIGGGPAGVEMAGNLQRLIRQQGGEARITLIAGSRLLKNFPPQARALALRSFGIQGIEVREGVSARSLGKDTVGLSNGEMLQADVVLVAAGIRPSRIFRDSGLPTGEDGGLLVNDYLQSTIHPAIFGGGDCISFAPRPLDKVGVYAVRQNPILFQNIGAALNNGAMAKFTPQKKYLLIFNLGDGTAIMTRGGLVLNGRLMFLLKNRIDEKFMKMFQVSGEREEKEDVN